MAVVVVVGLLAALAIPSAHKALLERRSANAAQQVALYYRMGRARAIGRGSAVLVRYSRGRVTVREAIVGRDASADGCRLATASSCALPEGRWEDNQLYQQIEDFNPAASDSSYDLLDFQFTAHGADTDSVLESADVCFTPSGRAFFRTQPGEAFSPLTGVPSIRVRMMADGEVIGLERMVLILPNGMARVAL